jgi:hypothetical protein
VQKQTEQGLSRLPIVSQTLFNHTSSVRFTRAIDDFLEELAALLINRRRGPQVSEIGFSRVELWNGAHRGTPNPIWVSWEIA